MSLTDQLNNAICITFVPDLFYAERKDFDLKYPVMNEPNWREIDSPRNCDKLRFAFAKKALHRFQCGVREFN